jgi:hypothetical protein
VKRRRYVVASVIALAGFGALFAVLVGAAAASALLAVALPGRRPPARAVAARKAALQREPEREAAC